MPLSAGTKLGPYKVEALLGAGGMGEVYRARDTRLDRLVAVKVLAARLSTSPEAKRRFDREARAISSLNHPNICTLYDLGHQDGTDFLVMEYLEGETLADRLTKGPLPPEQVLRYGVEICDGLEKAHKSGVIHRDLKPGNIMLTKSGAKLMDFGLAKATSDFGMPPREIGSEDTTTFATPPPGLPLTMEGTVLGTIQYMAPEQLEGKEADARSDIFALGTVLYEMASGRAAFTGQSHASIVAAILTYHPPAIAIAQPMSPSAFDSLVRVCLAKDPEERWQTAHDVKLQLRWIAESGSQPHAPAAPPAFAPSPGASAGQAGPARAAAEPGPRVYVAPPPAAAADPVTAPHTKQTSEKLAWTVAGIAAVAVIAMVLVFVLHVPLPFGFSGDSSSKNAASGGSPAAAVADAKTTSATLRSDNPSTNSAQPSPSPASEASAPAPQPSAALPASSEKPQPKRVVDTRPLSDLKPQPGSADKTAPASAPLAPPQAPPVLAEAARPASVDPAKLLQQGKGELAAQNAQAARESFKKAAEAGNAQAAVLLGTLYAQGLGGPKSDWDAVRMFRQAADAGYPRGMFNLGLMYELGRVVPVGQDNKAAAHWYTEAANRGDSDASFRLGLMYEEGRGVAKDLNEASRLYAKSSNPDAKTRLAKISQETH
jgi:TPR repeat protein